MNIVADLHTHTVASTHAADTIRTICEFAEKRGLQAVAITDHGPAVPGGADHVYFNTLWRLTSHIETALRVISGIEDDVVNIKGDLSLADEYLERLEIVTAGCHPFTWMAEQSRTVRTDAIINAVMKGKIRVLTHPVGTRYDIDLTAVVDVCADTGVALELNESKVGDEREFLSLLEQCAKKDAYTVVSSDAHVADEVGIFPKVLSFLKTVRFPEKLVVNRSAYAIRKFFGIPWEER
jgi:putative hydrolase